MYFYKFSKVFMRLMPPLAIRSYPSPSLRSPHHYQLGVCPFKPCSVHFYDYLEKIDNIAFWIFIYFRLYISFDVFSHTTGILEVLLG